MLIEKDIPIPAGRKPGRSADKYAILQDMVIGDSVMVTGVKAASVAHQARIVGKDTGYKFAVRPVEGGVRVWRVK
jgi:hypothetical protein